MSAFEQFIVIPAPPAAVWRALTEPAAMASWMAEPEVGLAIETDWSVGGAIVTRGFHHVAFVNRGTVLRFEPPVQLVYTHLSSISRLPDEPASHATFAFSLRPASHGTELGLAVSGCATDAILNHLRFYWRGTLPVLARVAAALP